MLNPANQPLPSELTPSFGARHGKPNKTAATPAAEHPVLSRLIEEVRNEQGIESRYDRMHNRHNRGR